MNGKIENLMQQVKTDTEEKTSIASAEKAFETELEAEKAFSQFGEKLLYIDRWNTDSGVSSFRLFEPSGEKAADRPAEIGDHICIHLPGTGKNDWVKVVDIREAANEKVLTVQPSFDPTDESADKSVTSHFFTDESTNNFCLQLNNKHVKMYVIGLNEISNTKNTNNLIESARNFATANLGHFLGVQKAEWTTFCNNFLEIPKSE
jgi:hypothetical protein